MSWQSPLWHWLIYAGISSCLLFAVAIVAMMVTDQPARRLRFIQWAFIGALLAPLVNEIGATPQWHLGLFGEAPAVAETSNESPPPSTESNPPSFGGGGMGSPDGRIGIEPVHNAGKGIVASVPKSPAKMKPIGGNAAESEESATSIAANEPDSPLDFRAIILLAYSGIAGGMLLWWMLGLLRLLHLKRKSRPTGDEVSAMFRQIAGDDALAKRVQLRISDNVPAPLTFGFRQPVIILPWTVCQPGQENALRYCLAHEWDHVQRRDILPWQFAALMQVLFFFQPMFWWMRRQMRLCQDYLADSFAARHADVPEDYAEFLVKQAKRCTVRYAAALGFAPSRSSLFRRVEMILNDDKQLETRPRRWWNAAVASTALGVVAAIGAVRLDAAASKDDAKPEKAVEDKKKPAKPQAVKDVKPLTYNGVVVNRVTGEPIAGATVIIDRTISKPKKGEEDWKRTTKVKSDAKGRYSFTLPAEEVKEYYLYIEVDCHHPEYVAKGRSGYGHSMIRKNLKLGEKPFYSKIRLWPGKEVTGTVVSPDGKPVKGVEVMQYSKHKKSKRFDFGGFYKTHTDDKGNFRFVAATPGAGVFWVTPKGFAPQAHMIPEGRGDVGKITLQHGYVLKGKILNAKGKPVSNVRFEARRTGDGEDVDSFLGQNAVANHIGRTGVTNAKGEFTLDEVPSGDYRYSVSSPIRGWGHRPLKDVFLRGSLKVKDREKPEPLTIRAVPHVEIKVKFFNSKGKPTGSHRFSVFGRMDGRNFFHTRSTMVNKKTGIAIARVPHGLQRVQVSLMTNEHGILRWRLKPGDALKNTRRVDLGTLESDHSDLEVVRYVAPILLVKAVDAKGKIMKNFKPKAVYVQGKSGRSPGSRFINGIKGDVYFESQQDGRWRSNSLQPDQKVSVTVQMDGYTTQPQEVSMPEGKTRALVFKMTPAKETAGKKPKKSAKP